MEHMSDNRSNTGTDSADFDWSDWAVKQQDTGSVFDFNDDAFATGGCAQ